MKSYRRFFLVLILPLILFVSALGQNSAQEATANGENTPVFHAQSKLVVVDVVVIDKSGKAVTGLKASDFRLTENGKRQVVSVFEER